MKNDRSFLGGHARNKSIWKWKFDMNGINRYNVVEKNNIFNICLNSFDQRGPHKLNMAFYIKKKHTLLFLFDS